MSLTFSAKALAGGVQHGLALAPGTPKEERGHEGLESGAGASSPPFVRR